MNFRSFGELLRRCRNGRLAGTDSYREIIEQASGKKHSFSYRLCPQLRELSNESSVNPLRNTSSSTFCPVNAPHKYYLECCIRLPRICLHTFHPLLLDPLGETTAGS